MRGAGPQARTAGPLERGAFGERGRHDPRPRPDPTHGARRRCRRQVDRGTGPSRRRHGCLPPTRHARHSAARRVPLRRCLRAAEGVRLLVHVGVHHHDADRCVPRRRATRGHLRDRAVDGFPGCQDGHRPARAPATQLHPDGELSLRGVHGPHVRLGRPRSGGRRRRSNSSATQRPGPARPNRTSRARPSDSASACRATSRCAGSPRRGCSRR